MKLFCAFLLLCIVCIVGIVSEEVKNEQIPKDQKEPKDIDWIKVLGGMLGGLSIFLYGMKLLGDSLRASAGERMKEILSAVSSSQFLGLITGIIVTAILQSSAVVGVMIVGFVSSGLMTLDQSLGILLGSGIGTTFTSHIVSVDITTYTMYLITLGFGLFTFGKSERVKQIGSGLLGLGLIFFGLQVMSDSMRPLRTYQPFISLLVQMSNPILAVIVSAVFTALIQSSTASVGIVIVLASQQLVSLRAGVSLILGANVGTAVTPIVAVLGPNNSREAERVALANMIFKGVGAVMMLPFLNLFLEMVAQTSDDLSRQIANAHTILNVIIALCFFPFLKQVSNLTIRLLPDRVTTTRGIIDEAAYTSDDHRDE